MYLIYGKGKVGLAVASLCEWKGIAYEICDDDNAPESYEKYDRIIPSPGIPGTHKIYSSGKVLSELDFAYQFLPRDFEIISVTGTDGKSTTAWIMYSILEKEYSVKNSVYLSGNFDIPFSATILDILKKGETSGMIVVEVSSFMAHLLQNYTSDYSIFTNFKPDHLNWHVDLQEYLDSKMNLISRSRKGAIINSQIHDFADNTNLEIKLPENSIVFKNTTTPEEYTTNGEWIQVTGENIFLLSDTNFSGKHNAMNILSCLIVSLDMGINFHSLKSYLKEIKGLPHRLEVIAQKGGITIVEDSKSTSSQSLTAALNAFGDTKNILLIAGGSDKGDSFDHMDSLFDARVRAVAAIGATKNQFISIANKQNIPVIGTDDLSYAVTWLFDQRIENHDILLLSPGCASFGLFKDYLDRANQFREIIKKLPH